MATPTAVAVREDLFTSSGLLVLIRQVAVYSCYVGVQLQYVVLLLDEALSSIGRLFFTLLNALAKARPFDLGSLCVCSAVPCRVSGLLAGGSLGSVAGLALVLLWFFVASGDPGSQGFSFVSLFHLQNGHRPNS